MNQNITEYKNKPGDFKMYYCKASIKDGYYITNGDEHFYHFMGKNTCYSIPELLHPEDADGFLEAVERLQEAPQCLIARIKDSEGQYKCVYMVLEYNGRVFDGFRSFDMKMCNIMEITERYAVYEGLVRKYRTFMTIFQGMFLEYDFATDDLKVYEYRNNQSKSVCHTRLEELNGRIQQDAGLTGVQKAEFRVLYEAVKNGRDRIKSGIDAAVFHEKTENVRYECRLRTMYKDDMHDKVIGIIEVVSNVKPKKRYYLTEEAYDAGTGLLNKRAINEYALEKIHAKSEGVYLAIMDVDDFKRINDGFGHMFGDEVLAKVAEIIRSVLNARGAAGRFGGDEFMVVFEEIDSETTLRRILKTISKHIQWAFEDVEGLTVTTSIGIAKCPDDGVIYEELFQKADKCLYIAKAKGKNRFIIYDEAKHGTVVNEEAANRNIGLKANISEAEKHAVISELILKLHREGKDALHDTMEQMQIYFDIDGIALYAGEDMHRTGCVGKYVNPIENLTFMFEPEYQAYFDEQGFYIEGVMARLENKVPLAYRMYTEQENKEMIQCAVLDGNKPLAVVAFDFFNRAPKLGTLDKGLIKIAGRMMAQVIAETESRQSPNVADTWLVARGNKY